LPLKVERVLQEALSVRTGKKTWMKWFLDAGHKWGSSLVLRLGYKGSLRNLAAMSIGFVCIGLLLLGSVIHSN